MTARAAAFTLVEVLVAIAVFALLATAVAGLWSAALRMTAAAEASAARTRALEPYTVPAALLAAPPPACGTTAGGDGVGPCLDAVTRCDLEAGRVRCEGLGGLGRMDVRAPPGAAGAGDAAGEAGATRPVLRAWARWRP